MREFILAMRAIWQSWHEGAPLKFEGSFMAALADDADVYSTDTDYGAPKVFLAAVGP